jgi:hypothetical protein
MNLESFTTTDYKLSINRSVIAVTIDEIGLNRLDRIGMSLKNVTGILTGKDEVWVTDAVYPTNKDADYQMIYPYTAVQSSDSVHLYGVPYGIRHEKRITRLDEYVTVTHVISDSTWTDFYRFKTIEESKAHYAKLVSWANAEGFSEEYIDE